MNTTVVPSPTVNVWWLKEYLNASNLVILDCTIEKVVDNPHPFASSVQIPNARFFDLKEAFSDTNSPFPTTFPSEKKFNSEARKLGIDNDSAIVVYDDKGIYSSARVWWMFKAMGHQNIAVLNGGLPEWIKMGYKTVIKRQYDGPIGDFEGVFNPNYMKFFEDVKEASSNKSHKIIDARSTARFNSLEPEPRAGLRMGNIPNSDNLPYEDLMHDYKLKSPADLKQKFESIAQKDDPIIFSCGSGITACILALGAELSGYKNISVYDGSWTEWGTLVS